MSEIKSVWLAWQLWPFPCRQKIQLLTAHLICMTQYISISSKSDLDFISIGIRLYNEWQKHILLQGVQYRTYFSALLLPHQAASDVPSYLKECCCLGQLTVTSGSRQWSVFHPFLIFWVSYILPNVCNKLVRSRRRGECSLQSCSQMSKLTFSLHFKGLWALTHCPPLC